VIEAERSKVNQLAAWSTASTGKAYAQLYRWQFTQLWCAAARYWRHTAQARYLWCRTGEHLSPFSKNGCAE